MFSTDFSQLFNITSLGLSLLCLGYNIGLTSFRYSTFEVYNHFDTLTTTVLMGATTYCVHWLNEGGDIELKDNKPITALVFGMQLLLVYLDRKKNVEGQKYQNQNLDGLVYVVTGCNTGIGLETVRALLKMGATVIMACRSVSKANGARDLLLKEIKCAPSKAIVIPIDLCDFKSVRKFVKDFEALGMPLHGLINNAGLMMSERTLTPAGLEMVFTANHLSHFLLTNLLLPALEKTQGRVVNLSSSIHRLAPKFNFDDVMTEKNYELFSNYAQSKLANILFTKELQRRMTECGSGVTCVSVHPGCVRTEVTRHMSPIMQFLNNLFAPILASMQKTPEQGAYTSIHAAIASPHALFGKKSVKKQSATSSAKEREQMLQRMRSGGLLFHCRLIPVSPAAEDKEAAKRLWLLSEKLTGYSASSSSTSSTSGANKHNSSSSK